MLIDVAISADRNVIKKGAEKDSKIQRPYNKNRTPAKLKRSDTNNKVQTI
jgi:hypothetical protein